MKSEEIMAHSYMSATPQAPSSLADENPWLLTFPPDLRRRLLALIRVRDLDDGRVIFRADDPPDGLYGVLRGRVRLMMRFPHGQQLLNHVAEAGDWFGEISTLDGRPRLNDAICAAPTRIAHLPQADADRVMQDDPAFVRAMARLASRRHRAAMAFAARALTQPLNAQIAYALLSLARKQEGREYDLDLRQEDVASIVGSSRQTVAIHLRRLSARGLIALGYRSIRILDRPALQAEAGATHAERQMPAS